MKRSLLSSLAVGAALILSGCGDGSSGYIVAGTISGLGASGLVLRNNGGDDLIVQIAASSFQFTTPVAAGGSYDVTVASQPAGSICTVTQGAGTHVQATVSSVKIFCSVLTYTVAGSISGLTASGLVLQNNGTDDLAVAADATTFQFSTAVAAGGGYSVVPSAQPAGLTCTVSNGVGGKVNANVSGIRVSCSPTTLALGGTVTGLTGSGLILQDNGTDDLSIPAIATTFRFPAPIAYGGGYAVTVSAQPSGQTCSIANGASTATIDVANIVVSCADISTFTLSAASSGSGAIAPAGSITVNRGSSQGFVATPSAGYGVHQWLLDGTVAQVGGDVYTLSNVSANHTLQVTFAQTTLTPSVSALALAVGDTATNAALTGAARLVVISNTGSIAATNLSISYPTLPAGTSASSTCGNTLAPAASCEIIVTPGINATSNCTSGIVPTPGVVSIASDESSSSSFTVTILGYGCLYQGGYVFAIDDTTPATGSIAGKVAAVTDQAPAYPNGVMWSSNGTPGQPDFFDIPGIDETSTTPCIGAIDGTCNTLQIVTQYSPASAFPPSLYAAGLCLGTMSGYSDWYLPAVCEMGFDGAGVSGSGCGSSSSPLVQNMQSNLTGLSNVPSGYYWSSTEYSADPAGSAWVQDFTPGGSFPSYPGKDNLVGVRCVRAMSN